MRRLHAGGRRRRHCSPGLGLVIRILLWHLVPVVRRILLLRLIAIIRLVLPRLSRIIWVLLVLLSRWGLINPGIRFVLGER